MDSGEDVLCYPFGAEDIIDLIIDEDAEDTIEMVGPLEEIVEI